MNQNILKTLGKDFFLDLKRKQIIKFLEGQYAITDIQKGENFQNNIKIIDYSYTF